MDFRKETLRRVKRPGTLTRGRTHQAHDKGSTAPRFLALLFNVGITDPGVLVQFLDDHADNGIFLNILGFGHGNLRDSFMQELAQQGGGIAAYVDSFAEARKLFVTDIHKNLSTIARDVKAQVEFNPQRVTDYRLLGYESRLMTREQFEDPDADAAETGAGHQVTVLYELTLDDQPGRLGERRYGPPAPANDQTDSTEIGFLRLRWQTPGAQPVPSEITLALTDAHVTQTPGPASRFAAAVAAVAAYLADHPLKSRIDLGAMHDLAASARQEDPHGYRAEFVQLLGLVRELPRTPDLTP